MTTTRFAPSPTGPLHLGHAYSAILAHDRAVQAGGTFLLRIEDLDQSRARPEWETQIATDLSWLGLTWEEPVMRQSDRLTAYEDALAQLDALGLIYPCRCNRRDIEAASAPQEGAPQFGPDGRIYPGTCRNRSLQDATQQDALRLNIHKAASLVPSLTFDETGPTYQGRHHLDTTELATSAGDIILRRRDMGGSYHLAVVVDDAAQGVTEVTRGEDLFDATPLHVLLQSLLGLPTPTYHHHALIRDDQGKRLAKRDDARALRLYRREGKSPQDIRQMIGV